MMNERKELIELFLDGFREDSEQFADWFIASAKPENILTLYEHNQLVSLGFIFDKKAWLLKKERALPYLSGLATRSEFRGKGKIRSVIETGFQNMFNRGDLITVLNPFDANYYKRFGYVDIIHSKKRIIEGGHDYTLLPLGESPTNILTLIEQKNALRFDNYLIADDKRTAWLLDNFSIDGGICKVIYDGDNPLAFYFSYGKKVDYYAEAIDGVLNRTSALKGMEFDELNNGSDAFIQARVINARKLILECPFDDSLEGVFCLKISDDIIEANNFEMLIEVANQKARQLDECAPAPKLTIALDVSELCKQVFSGGGIFKKQSCLFMDKY